MSMSTRVLNSQRKGSIAASALATKPYKGQMGTVMAGHKATRMAGDLEIW